ncbi:MAG: T9SS type A sorting domain-containing protein [Bacteroidota bacterium]
MAKARFLLLIFCIVVTYSFAQHPNIRIDNPEAVSSPNEPSIMINPQNTDQMMAGSNLKYYYVSEDGGYSWESYTLTSSENGVWGDPCIVVDTSGSFYFMHLANPASGNWIDRIVCQRTDDLGQSWPVDTFTGLNGAKAQDKEWAVVDRSNNHIYMTWTQFDEYDSNDPADSSIIRFSKSTDGGVSWSDALRINKTAGNCLDNDSTVEGAVPAVGPEGQIYVAWSGPDGIVFDKSYDQGETWLQNDIPVDPHPGGWDLEIPGIYRANGMPVTTCDTSGGEHHGTIYINWSDQRNGSDDTDVWLSKSTDEGETWSEPVRVNDDPPGKHQFFTWMTIDQTNGKLYFVFYDRRNHEGIATDVYMAFSEDGGETFTNFKISENPFEPVSSVFFGDYTNVSAHNDVIRPVWAAYENGMKLYTAIVDPLAVNIEKPLKPSAVTKTFPNPFTDQLNLRLAMQKPGPVSVELHSVRGQKLGTLIENKVYPSGKHSIALPVNQFSLPDGVYYLKIIRDKQVSMKKIVRSF